jgi:hypothetical protein
MSSKWSVSQTYDDCERLVRWWCNRFYVACGGYFDDWLSDANLIFLAAYEEFDPELGIAFTEFLSWRLEQRLSTVVRDFKRQSAKRVSMPNDHPRREGFLDRIMKDLSDDGKFLLQTLIDPPVDVILGQFERRKAGRLKRGQRRSIATKEYLLDIGWKPSRVHATYRELKSCLS